MLNHVDDEEEITMFDKTALLGEAASPSRTSKCRKLLKTGFLCFGFFSLGLSIAIPGPTLAFLKRNVAVDTNKISYIFPSRAVGYLTGSIVSGFIYDKFPTKDKFWTALALLLTAIGVGAAPWTNSLVLLCIFLAASGISMGFLDTGGNVMVLKIWNKDSGPYIQTLHFMFGVGALVAPLIAAPFLPNAAIVNSTNTSLSTISTTLPSHTVHKRAEQPGPLLTPSVFFKSTLTNQLVSSNLSSKFNSSFDNTAFNSSIITTSTTLSQTTSEATIPPKPSHSGAGSEGGLDVASGKDVELKIDDAKELIETTLPSTTVPVDKVEQKISSISDVTNSSTGMLTPDTNETSSLNNSTKDSETAYSTVLQSSTTTISLIVPETKKTPLQPITTKFTTEATTASTTSTTASSTSATQLTTSTTVQQPTAPHVESEMSTLVTRHSTEPRPEIPSLRDTTPPANTDDTHSGIGNLWNYTTTVFENVTQTKERFPFLIIALCLLFCSISFCCMECFGGNDSSDSRQTETELTEVTGEVQRESWPYKIRILTGAFLFFMLYVGIEVAYGQFIAMFGIEYHSLSPKDGAFLTSIFWGSFTAGRGLSIPLSNCLNPSTLIILSLLLSLAAAIGLLVANIHKVAIHTLWVLSGAFGLGCAAIFPTGVLWIEKHVRVSAKMATVFVVGSAFGEMWVPAVVGALFEVRSIGPMALMYMVLGAIIGCGLLFLSMLFCARKTKESSYSPVQSDKSSESIPMNELDLSDSETDTGPIMGRKRSANDSTNYYSQ